jgi:hypothetical protein
MAYIKQKKVWTKKFIKEELDFFWGFFKGISPAYENEWVTKNGKSNFIPIVEKYGNFLHPETDISDNSVGIQPKRLTNWLKNGLNIYSLENIFFILNHYFRTTPEINRNFLDEDNFINWDSVWKFYVQEIFNGKIESLREEHGDNLELFIIGSVCKKLINNNRVWDNEIFYYIGENPWLIYFVENKNWNDLYVGKQLKKESFIDFFVNQKKNWKEKHNIIPKSLIMLSSNPSRFSKNVLSLIEKLYGVKQIGRLSISDQYNIVSEIEYFSGNVLSKIPFEIVSNGKLFRKIGSEVLDIEVNEAMFIIEKLTNSGYKLSLPQLSTYLKIFPSFDKKFIERLLSLGGGNLLSSNLNLYFDMERSNYDKDFKDFVWSLDPQYLKYVSRYTSHEVNLTQLSQFKNIWDRRSSKNTLPVLSGKVGKYNYDLIDKTKEKEGLFLGYATDCCQVIGGAGESCLTSGYHTENESFFIVRKKGKVYAQSWVWDKTTNDGKKVFCFDSIELLGNDLNEMQDVMNSYLEITDILINEYGYDLVIVGADGNRIPEGLNKYSIGEVNYESMKLIDINYSGPARYTDTRESGVLILGSSQEKDLK